MEWGVECVVEWGGRTACARRNKVMFTDLMLKHEMFTDLMFEHEMFTEIMFKDA